jgi:CHAD domain-containing protein
VDWTLAGDGTPIRGLDLAQRLAVLDGLDPEDFHEMRAAVGRHEAAQAAARVAEKNGQAGAPNAPAI